MKISRQTKEIINTVLFLLIVAAIVTVYIIYPLNRIKAQMARIDLDEYHEDSIPLNNPELFTAENLPADTFYFEADGLTKLACLEIKNDSALGTVILLHDDKHTRDSLLNLTKFLYENGYSIIIYDQRATGYSSGEYRSDGYLEATDLMALISTLEIREKISHPLITVGFGLGAEAILLAAAEEKRINTLIAIEPYFTTKRLQNVYKERYDTYWFPFYRTIMWWWFTMRSSYALPYREENDIQPVTIKALLLMDEKYKESNELKKFIEISNNNQLIIRYFKEKPENINNSILNFITSP
jgi:hypothetical protein